MTVFKIYSQVLRFPILLLCVVVSMCLLASLHLDGFTFDASSDTLVVQGDPKLAEYRIMSGVFGGDEFLVLTYSRRETNTLFSAESLASLAALQRDLEMLEGTQNVFSILDAPLLKGLQGPKQSNSYLYKTLRSPDVDPKAARIELVSSPIFVDFLISNDGEASAIRVELTPENELEEIRRSRDSARNAGTGTSQLSELEEKYHLARNDYLIRRAMLIEQVREIRDRYIQDAEIHIAGLPMIASDMINYVKSDLIVFGSIVLASVVILLFFFFRRARWVILPLLVSAVSILLTTGFLGYMTVPVTVVSANFMSLLAIICISFSIHLIVRYREVLSQDTSIENRKLVLETMRSKFTPCLYTGLTTLLAFGSMMGNGIVPVEDFGWMMCLGIVLSFIVTYAIFPAVLLIIGKAPPSKTVGQSIRLTKILSESSTKHSKTVLAVSLVLAVVAFYGLTRVTFENQFIDYFDDDTEIHAGMAFIDKHLGGTTPLDVYIKFAPYVSMTLDDDDDFYTEPETYPERYWFTLEKLNVVNKLHTFIERQTGVGKVVSISTLSDIAKSYNAGKALSENELLYVLGEIPVEIREQLIEPYARPELGIVRINARVKESSIAEENLPSSDSYSNNALIQSIESYAIEELKLSPNEITVTGMMVLFNDMLKQLAQSQLKTLLFVLASILIMFSLLLRSIVLAVLALVPNIIAASLVIAFMGYADIPMDMMTITIAAISVGIGVDDAIHYLHRFRKEYDANGNIMIAIDRTHRTIGRAMYFTSIIITIGFSILGFSNFLPTVYFGLLTAIAMILALLANLAILPSLLIQFYSDSRE